MDRAGVAIIALVIEFLRFRGGDRRPRAGVGLHGGIAPAWCWQPLRRNTNLQPYLFGSILTATANDVWTVIARCGVVVTIGFTDGPARGRARRGLGTGGRHPSRALNAMLAVLTAVTVVAMRTSGPARRRAHGAPCRTSRLARSFRGTPSARSGRRIGGAGAVRRPAVGAAAGGAIVLVWRRSSLASIVPAPAGPARRRTRCSPVPTGLVDPARVHLRRRR
jgi:hypothetical protein